jgi:glucose/arabinose dehydrogenase
MDDTAIKATILTTLTVLAGLGQSAFAAQQRVIYGTPHGTCDGYPRLNIGMAKGFCAGLIAGPTAGGATRQLVLPRSLAQLDDTTWLVTDLGGWDTARGAVLKLESHAGKSATLTPLITGLKLPHALALSPDGLAYVGEMSRIIRFDPRAADPSKTIETVIAGLPDNRLHDNRHPLSKFVFAPDGALLVNVGAPSDECLNPSGKPLGETCPETDRGDQAASIRRYALIEPGRWSQDYTVYAKGLRNSVALAVHSSGTILQGENSYDFSSRWAPFDEINRIEADHHYGWPYCADVATPTPGWKAARVMACNSIAHKAPVTLLPPHAAPLDMLWYDGAMFPTLKGQLLMTSHGYRSIGGRIAAFETDANGVPVPAKKARYAIYGGSSRLYGLEPAANALILTPGWGKVDGMRPQGSPVGLAIAGDGAIWTTDDRAGLIIRIATDRP